MKLTEQHVFKGYWWLPDKPEDKVAGVLTYSPGERILLELIGGFESEEVTIAGFLDKENNKVALIHGVDSNAMEISLVSCYRSFSYNYSSGFPIMHYSTRMAIYGKHINSLDEVCDYSAHVRFPELSYWAPPSAIHQVLHYAAEGNELESCSFHLKHFDSDTESICSVDCDNGVKLSIKKGVGYQTNDLMLNPELEQYSYLEIKKPHAGICIKDIFQEIYKFSSFLSLATKRNVRPVLIYLTDLQIRKEINNGENSYFPPIYILFVQRPASNPEKLDWNNFLFRYKDVANCIHHILPKWMSDTDNLQPIKSHLVESLVYKPVVSSVDFLQVVQAIEGVWWRFRDDSYKATHSISKKKKTDLNTILSEILSSLSTIPTIAKTEIDVKAVVDSRVYYTHFVDKSKRPKRLDGVELYDLTQKLRNVLLCLVLELLGMTHKEIDQILFKSQ